MCDAGVQAHGGSTVPPGGRRTHAAVDQDGHVLDILVQRRRDTAAATTFFRKLLKGLTYVPRVIVTDQLQSYSVPPCGRCCPASNIGSPGICTTARSTLTNPRGSVSGACSAFSRCMAPLPRTSDPDATSSRPPRDFGHGGR